MFSATTLKDAKMTVQEIFDLTAIKEIEINILDLQREVEVRHGYNGTDAAIIGRLLLIRKHLLDKEFIMDSDYKKLLSEFNDALRNCLIEMREKSIEAYTAVFKSGVGDDNVVVGKCFLGYHHSKIHPIQTIRAKKIWAVLNNSLDEYNLHYNDGVIENGWTFPREGTRRTENYMLYLNSDEDNWNDWFADKDMTQDMHIVQPVNHLLDHTSFSIFDLLWVRDFNIEITVETDYDTYKEEVESDELDWTEYDYLD